MSEIYRKLYRDIGYSLCGYLDVFCYCDKKDKYEEEDEEIFEPYELLATAVE